MRYSIDGSKVGILTNSSGTLVTRPSLVIGSAKQSKGERAPDGSKYRCLSYPAPVITSNGGGTTASVSVAENQTTITTVVATYTDTIIYSTFGGADYSLFTINPSTGVLTFSTAPDYETPLDSNGDNVYEVIVKASSPDDKLDTQLISVTVTDVDEDGIQGAHFDGLSQLRAASLVIPDSRFLSYAMVFRITDPGESPLIGDPGNCYPWALGDTGYPTAYTNIGLNSASPTRVRSCGHDFSSADLNQECIFDTTEHTFEYDQWACVMGVLDADHPTDEKLNLVAVNDTVFTVSNGDGDLSSGAYDIAFSGPATIGGSNAGPGWTAFVFVGDMHYLWIAPGQRVDFSVEANRRKFCDADGSPVDLGADGSVPTGVAPAVPFFNGNASSWETIAAANGWTITGTLTDAA